MASQKIKHFKSKVLISFPTSPHLACGKHKAESEKQSALHQQFFRPAEEHKRSGNQSYTHRDNVKQKRIYCKYFKKFFYILSFKTIKKSDTNKKVFILALT